MLRDPVNGIDPSGLNTYGISINASAGWGAGITSGYNFVFDDHGNFAIQKVEGAGGDTPGASLTFDAEYTNADTVDKLTGPGVQAGIDAGEGTIIEAGGMAGDGYTGGYSGFGFGGGVLPAGFSGYYTNTTNITTFNVYGLLNSISNFLNLGDIFCK